jgi:hypothetical protein
LRSFFIRFTAHGLTWPDFYLAAEDPENIVEPAVGVP